MGTVRHGDIEGVQLCSNQIRRIEFIEFKFQIKLIEFKFIVIEVVIVKFKLGVG